jgi:hypothetical protein
MAAVVHSAPPCACTQREARAACDLCLRLKQCSAVHSCCAYLKRTCAGHTKDLLLLRQGYCVARKTCPSIFLLQNISRRRMAHMGQSRRRACC